VFLFLVVYSVRRHCAFAHIHVQFSVSGLVWLALLLWTFMVCVDGEDARTLDTPNLSRKSPQDLRIIVERWLTTGNLQLTRGRLHYCGFKWYMGGRATRTLDRLDLLRPLKWFSTRDNHGYKPQEGPVTGSNNCFCEAAIKAFFPATIYWYFKLQVLTFAKMFWNVLWLGVLKL
jgi:hypothetical protein